METRSVAFNTQIHKWLRLFWFLVLATFIMLQPRLFAQTIVWSRLYGGAGDNVGNAVLETSDLGFVNAGYAYSITGGEDSDMYHVKTDGTGETDWFLTHTSSGYQMSGTWLVDNVRRNGGKYGERV